MMKLEHSFLPVLAASALAALTASAARADLKVVQTTTIDSPQLKAYMETMTPQQRAQMGRSANPLLSGAPQRTTVYVHGTKTRADIGPVTYIVDAATRQATTVNRTTRTYTSQPYTQPSAGGSPNATVKDTGQIKMIAGHPSRRYFLTATIPSQPGTLIQSDIWAAQDLSQPPPLTTGGGPLSSLQNLFKKIKGYPMQSSLAITGSPLGSTTVKTSVVSVSQAPLPASLFAIPAGYKKAAQ